jgi:RNA polymerase sigma-70 factor (ECF subfamily)
MLADVRRPEGSMRPPRDRSWFVDQVRQHQARLRATVRALGVRADAVDDLSQDALVLAWQKRDGFEAGGDFGAWVAEIARRLAANERRKEARRSRLQAGEVTAFLLRRAEAPADPLTGLGHDEALAALRGCCDDLPPDCRELIRLRYFDQLAPGAIAGQLGRPSGHVRQTLLRIRRRLLDCVEHRLAGMTGRRS